MRHLRTTNNKHIQKVYIVYPELDFEKVFLIIELGGRCTEGVHNSDFGHKKIILGVVKFYQVVSSSIGHEVWIVKMMFHPKQGH
jgi:hypothetical protein